MARHVAKNLVAAGLADRAMLQVAYAIGVADPVSILVESFGTAKVSDAVLEGLVRRHFDFTPSGIIKYLNLRRPIYRKTAAYGHFGRAEPEFTWERTDRVKDLRDDAGL
jgi:S-adenosylmethionine synthetase